MVYWLPSQITSDKDKKRVQEQQDAGWLPRVKCRPLTISVTPAKYGCNWCAPLEMNGPYQINVMPDGFKRHHFGKIQNFPYRKYIEIPRVTYNLEEWAMESGVRHDPRYLRFFFEVFADARHAGLTPLHDDWKCEAVPRGLLSEADVLSFDTELRNVKRPLTQP